MTLLEMKALPPLDLNSLIPKLDTGGITVAIKTLWDAFSAQQQLCSTLAAQLQQHKSDTDAAMTDMKDHLYGVINNLKDELHKTREENKEMNNALRDLVHASERDTRRKIDDTAKDLNDRVNDVQQQLTHNAHVANTALERALDAKEKSDENAQKIADVEDTLATDLSRLYRTIGLTKADARKAVDNGAELETMLATPPLAHILKLLGEKSSAGLSPEDVSALNDIRSRLARLEERLGELGGELRASDKILSSRIDRLESAVKGLEYNQKQLPSAPTSAASSNNNNNAAPLGSEQLEALTSALSKLRGEVAQIRSALDHVTREVGKKVDQDEFDKLADGLASLAHRVATLEGTLNDTRGSVDEALRLARLAVRNAGGSSSNTIQSAGGERSVRRGADGVDASAIMMLRDQVDGLAGRIAGLERELNDVDAKKSTHDELNRALQDVLKAMEQAISQLYDELRKQLGAGNYGGQFSGDYTDANEPATSARFRCLSCNRRSGPLQAGYHERMSKPMLPPSDTLAGNGSASNNHGISPPRTSPLRSPPVPGVRDGFEPRPLTGSRRKLQTYYDWLYTMKGSGGGGGASASPQDASATNTLQQGLVGKTFMSKQPGSVPAGTTTATSSSADQIPQQKFHEQVVMTSARVGYVELPPARSESPNPATVVGTDGRHYQGVQARNSASVLPRSTPTGDGGAASNSYNNNNNSGPSIVPSRPGTATRR